METLKPEDSPLRCLAARLEEGDADWAEHEQAVRERTRSHAAKAGTDAAGTAGKPSTATITPTPFALSLSPKRQGQTRLVSFLEALLNTAIGFGIAVAANLWLLPLWGFSPSLGTSLEIGLVFTFISVVRSYLLRRLFNWIHMIERTMDFPNTPK